MMTTTDYMNECLAQQDLDGLKSLENGSILSKAPEDIEKNIVDYIIYQMSVKYGLDKREEALYRWDEYQAYLSSILDKEDEQC